MCCFINKYHVIATLEHHTDIPSCVWIFHYLKDSNTLESFIVFLISVLYLLKDSNTLESFIVFLISVLSLLFFFFSDTRLESQISETAPHSATKPLSDDVHKNILVSIQITVLDLEPNPDFQTFLIISKTYHRIFKCNTSKRRSGQELPFIFFELRAPTCLWGRYDPKPEKFTLFYIYLLHIHSFSKTIYILV